MRYNALVCAKGNEMSNLLLDKSDGLAILTLNRPDIHNAFDDTLIADMTAALQDIDADPSVRVLVLSANGSSFSAGADLNWMKRMAAYTEEQNLHDAMWLARLMSTLNNLSKPTVARVQGPAYGGGVGLVACCDIAVASHDATFALSEARLGIIPAVISPYLIAAIGERTARRYMLTTERFDAAEAYRIGLVHELVLGEEDLDDCIERFIKALFTAGPVAQRECKDLIRAVARHPISDPLILDTAKRIARIRVSPEGREGMAAFLDKRNADWSKTS
jgi:methylglutaconyl-CoA hydratase